MIYINAYSAICALGSDNDKIATALLNTQKEYLTKSSSFLKDEKSSYFGVINADLKDLCEFDDHNSRNNRVLATLADRVKPVIEKLKQSYGSDRIGVVMGTSTSGLEETADALKAYLKDGSKKDDFKYSYQEFGSPSNFLSDYLSVKGPSYTISTACSSSARALLSAKNLIESGLCDAVIAGGADTLCSVPINGFDAMSVLSYDRCIPFNADRHGINIGEGGGLMVLSKQRSSLVLKAVGQSSDAYHPSAPDPTGEGAIRAMTLALKEANLETSDIGYINMHGTATKLNDSMEALAVYSMFKDSVPCSSTKYLTGHTLGASGILEACILCLLIDRKLPLPAQDFSKNKKDEELSGIKFVKDTFHPLKMNMMSNSFAFGGNNTCVIIGENNE